MLKALVRVCDLFLKRDIAYKKFFGLFDLPDAQPRGFVDLMLKKNRHECDLRFKIADLILIGENFKN